MPISIFRKLAPLSWVGASLIGQAALATTVSSDHFSREVIQAAQQVSGNSDYVADACAGPHMPKLDKRSGHFDKCMTMGLHGASLNASDNVLPRQSSLPASESGKVITAWEMY